MSKLESMSRSELLEQLQLTQQRMKEISAKKTKKSADVEFINSITAGGDIKQKYRSDIYEWNGKCWMLRSDKEIAARAFRFLGDTATASKAKTCAESLALHAEFLEDPRDLGKDIIPTLGGYLEINGSGQVKRSKIDKNLGFDYYVNATLIQDELFEKAYEGSLWKKFIESVIEDHNSRAVFQEFFGYTFLQTRCLDKMMMLTGSGSNGKSRLQQIMIALHHKNFALDPGKLNGTFDLAGMETSTIAIAGETDAQINEQTLKKLVTGDPIPLQKKYKDPIKFVNKSKLIFACNELPRTKDHSDGYWRRLIVVPFLAKFYGSRRDPLIAEKIIERELDIVFTWAINGLRRLAANKYQFTESEVINSTIDSYKIDTNSALGFITQYGIAETEEHNLRKSYIFEEYKNFCMENGMHNFTSVKFWKIINEHIEKKYGFKVSSKQKRIGGEAKLFVNFRLTSPKAATTTDENEEKADFCMAKFSSGEKIQPFYTDSTKIEGVL